MNDKERELKKQMWKVLGNHMTDSGELDVEDIDKMFDDVINGFKQEHIIEFTKDEKSLLLFLETCLVDSYGKVASVHMNSEDMEIVKKLSEKGLIEFGRLTFETIQKTRGNALSHQYTHWVRFSDEAWKLTHQLRRERSERMIEKRKNELEAEMTKNK